MHTNWWKIILVSMWWENSEYLWTWNFIHAQTKIDFNFKQCLTSMQQNIGILRSWMLRPQSRLNFSRFYQFSLGKTTEVERKKKLELWIQWKNEYRNRLMSINWDILVRSATLEMQRSGLIKRIVYSILVLGNCNANAKWM